MANRTYTTLTDAIQREIIDAGGKRRFEEKVVAGEEIVFQLGPGQRTAVDWNQLSAADRQLCLFSRRFVKSRWMRLGSFPSLSLLSSLLCFLEGAVDLELQPAS